MVFSSIVLMFAHLSNLPPPLSCCLFFPLSTSFSIFNPADYTANSRARQEAWDGNEPAEGTGKDHNGTLDVTF